MKIKSTLRTILNKKYSHDFNNPVYTDAIKQIREMEKKLNNPLYTEKSFDERKERMLTFESELLKSLKPLI